MATEIDPPQLGHLLDLSERPRVDDWSLRAALVRYGQPQPQRASEILEVVRRIDAALKPTTKTLEKDGPAIWDAVIDETEPPAEAELTAPTELVALLRTAAVLDGLGDVLAAWAIDPAATAPDTDVDTTVAEVAARLDELGIPREERERPPRRSR